MLDCNINQLDSITRRGIELVMKLQVSTVYKYLKKFAASKYAAQGKC